MSLIWLGRGSCTRMKNRFRPTIVSSISTMQNLIIMTAKLDIVHIHAVVDLDLAAVRAEAVDDAAGVQPHRCRAERRFVKEIALASLLKLHAGVKRSLAREHNAARLHAQRRFCPLHTGELALLPGEQRFLLVLAVLSGCDKLHSVGAVHALLYAGDRYDNVFHSHDIHSRHAGLPGNWFIDYMRKHLR